jgi:hypothetical protein
MLILSTSSFAIGVLLAMKFRVLVLVPVILLGAALISVVSGFHPIAQTCGEIVGYATLLQFGYLVGAGAYQALLGDHANKSRRTSLVPPTL